MNQYLNYEKEFLMKRLSLVVFILLFAFGTHASAPQLIPGVIYGDDNRQEVVDTSDTLMIERARSTAGMFSTSSLSAQSNGDYKIIGKTLVERGWCPTERFSNQITSPVCTGFLVAADIIATAGHCVSKSTDCKNYQWVFDHKLASNTDTTTVIAKNNVYKCKSIIATVNSSTSKDDYALLRLDRKVLDRPSLEIRKSGKISDGASLVLIGHPKGLPMKIADRAFVRSNSATKYFVANTDSYAGNSGSPVLDATTGIVEGILVRGESDYITTSTGCYASFICSSTGCSGEDVTRTTNLPAF